MKGKSIPPAPHSLEAVLDVWAALPRFPEPESVCLDRLVDQVHWIDDETSARTWIAFFRAIGLIRHDPAGVYRGANRPDRQQLVDRFLARVYGADAVGETLSPTIAIPLDELASAVRIPPWEQRRHEAPERVWRERTKRLLDWYVLLGLARERNGRYRAV